MHTKKQKNQFFDEHIQQIANKFSIPQDNIKAIEILSQFNSKLDKKINKFEILFKKASPKLKTLMWYNPHLQVFLMETKAGMWVSFEEMFPGNVKSWNFLLRTNQLFYEKSLNIIFEELQIIKPSLHRIKNNFFVDLKQAKQIISDNIDIFGELKKIKNVAISNEEAKSILHKISANLNPQNLPYVKSVVGLLLGYPQKQILMHQITDHLDLHIFIPKFNDFTMNGFYEQTYPLLSGSSEQNKLTELFAYLEETNHAMNNETASFKEQDYHLNQIMIALSDNVSFLRNIIFEHYLPQSISQQAADTLDEYILYSFPHLAFPTTLSLHQFGLNWLEYQPDLSSELQKGKILLTLKKISEWKKKMRKGKE